MAVREPENPVENVRRAQLIPRASGAVLKQPAFYWKASDKYHELNNFESEAKTFPQQIIISHKKVKRCQ